MEIRNHHYLELCKMLEGTVTSSRRLDARIHALFSDHLNVEEFDDLDTLAGQTWALLERDYVLLPRYTADRMEIAVLRMQRFPGWRYACRWHADLGRHRAVMSAPPRFDPRIVGLSVHKGCAELAAMCLCEIERRKSIGLSDGVFER